MLRLELSVEDLARVRFETAPGPLVDTAMAARAIRQRHRPAWVTELRRVASAELDRSVGPLLLLAPPTGHCCDFISPFDADVPDGLEHIASVSPASIAQDLDDTAAARYARSPWLRRLRHGDREPRRDLVRAVARFHTVVRDRGPDLAAVREADVAARLGELTRHGLASVLNSLHRSVRLRGTVLEIDRPWDYTHRTAGRGLVLVPSPYLSDEVRVRPDEHGPTVVFYPAPLFPGADDRAGDSGPNVVVDPLGRLLGATRAAVLRAVRTGATTTELAARARISLASASQHASALRYAGLVCTRRTGKAVVHRLRPLGADLLREVSGSRPRPR